MPLQRVLWLVNGNEPPAGAGCETLPPGLGFSRVSDLAEASAAIRSEKPDCILISGQAEGNRRREVLDLFLGTDVQTPVIFWDRDLSAREAIELVREGAYTCLGERDPWSSVLESIEQACQEKQRRQQAHPDTQALELWRRKLVGTSPAMEDVANTIRLVGPFKCTVLITGETGTGKEMAARALHNGEHT